MTDMLSDVHEYQREIGSTAPVLLHCSAGVGVFRANNHVQMLMLCEGRTGAIISIDHAVSHLFTRA